LRTQPGRRVAWRRRTHMRRASETGSTVGTRHQAHGRRQQMMQATSKAGDPSPVRSRSRRDRSVATDRERACPWIAKERCINQIGQLPNVVAHIRGDSWTSHNVYYVIVGAAARRRMAGPVPGNPPGTACAPDDAGRVRATARPRRQRTTARRRGPNADAARTSHAGIPTPAGSGSAFLQHLANQHLANPAARADRPGPCRIALTTPSPACGGRSGWGRSSAAGGRTFATARGHRQVATHTSARCHFAPQDDPGARGSPPPRAVTACSRPGSTRQLRANSRHGRRRTRPRQPLVLTGSSITGWPLLRTRERKHAPC
jgi:hypothetical protein